MHMTETPAQGQTQSVFALLPLTAKTTDFTFTSVILHSGSLRLGVQKNISITHQIGLFSKKFEQNMFSVKPSEERLLSLLPSSRQSSLQVLILTLIPVSSPSVPPPVPWWCVV